MIFWDRIDIIISWCPIFVIWRKWYRANCSLNLTNSPSHLAIAQSICKHHKNPPSSTSIPQRLCSILSIICKNMKDHWANLSVLKLNSWTSISKTTQGGFRGFIQRGGLLTGEGIANTYFCASKLKLSSEWLEENIHHEIPSKIKFMNRTNLKDTLEGLKQFHSNSPYLKEIEQELSKKS